MAHDYDRRHLIRASPNGRDTMTAETTVPGQAEFLKLLEGHLRIGDRTIFLQHGAKTLDPSSVYINFFNLPKAHGVGGADGANNRVLLAVTGFDRKNPDGPPPTGKVKVEATVSFTRHTHPFRAKTGAPAAIAKYIADYLNKIAAEVEPKIQKPL